ncbi:MAG TPA: type II and III secretion system protein family protein, partial [Burkholderiaceae bacterium]|nr:type II and III secretion system protein family protein [Burkholderiaceae bacterium]
AAEAAREIGSRRPQVADVDVLLLSPREIYMLGKTIGATNIVLVDRAGLCTVLDVTVSMDTATVADTLKELLPGEPGIKVSAAADSLVLSGTVSDAAAAERAVEVAGAYVRRSSAGRGEAHDRVLNMLSVAAPQQVMLEVKVAEISKTVLDQFGINFARAYSPADGSLIRFLTGIFGGAGIVGSHLGGTTNGNVGSGAVGANSNGVFTGATTVPAGDASIGGDTVRVPIAAGKNTTNIGVDAQKKDGLVKVLAEPTVMAVSGQEGSFLAGGKIFIPVSRANGGVSAIELVEKEFGVSLKFTPTVLADGRINLRVNPEVSELNPQGIGITAPGITGLAILPSFTTRRAATTVQLFDGQSFAIGGLIKNNVNANIKAFPLLGELPIIGALFRSSDFQTDRSELVFVITPRLVKPLPPDYTLPTDSYTPPTRSEFYLDGKLEGSRKQGGSSTDTQSNAPTDTQTDTPPAVSGLPAGGFQVK